MEFAIEMTMTLINEQVGSYQSIKSGYLSPNIMWQVPHILSCSHTSYNIVVPVIPGSTVTIGIGKNIF